MKKISFTLAFLLTATLTLLHAQTELSVIHPQSWWWSGSCAIEEASITVSPHGLYTEVGVYLTFDSPDFIPLGDSFEIDMKFPLPEGALIVDSWLWIGDDIIRAAILDRWTATTIYEGIVNRRQDPSILARMEDGRYHLQIYPVVAEENRRIKITYLVPAQWSTTEVVSVLPMHLIEASETPVSSIDIRVNADSIWGTPRFQGLSSTLVWSHPAPDVWEIALPGTAISRLVLDAPLEDGIFVRTLPTEGPDVYQMAISPEELFDLGTTEGRKLLMTIEYHPGNSASINQTILLQKIREHLLATLSPGDYFNMLAVDDFAPRFFRPHWVAAHPDSIEAAIAEVTAYTTLPDLSALLPASIDFIQNNGGDGQVMLFANSDYLSHFVTANTLIEGIENMMDGQLIPIHVCDFQTNGFENQWIEDVLYRGNEYLYTNLTRLSGGSFFNLLNCCQTLDENLNQLFELQNSIPGTIDVHTSLEEGFSFQRYNLGINSGLTDLKKPILQVGRLQGNGAFRIEVNMESNGVFQSQEILLNDDLSVHSDSMIREMWAGNHLAFLEAYATSNASIQAAVQFSIDERVLGDYTAFLCVEPSLGGEPCAACAEEEEGDIVIDSEQVAFSQAPSWNAAPNPFSDRVTIALKLPENLHPGDCAFALYDATGRMVRQFAPQDLTGHAQDWQLVWDARNENGVQAPAGMYVLVLSTPQGKYQLKLMCVR